MTALFTHTDDDSVRLAEKVAFLSSPAAHSDETTTVEAVETHMAWVFLTSSYAYKLKKPVRSPSLDFSTIDKRRVDCEEEVRLNRRLAPDVYLGVLPLVISREGVLSLGVPDVEQTAVDWLVHMRRLPADGMLDAQIAHGTLVTGDLDRLANTLARFYRHATPVGMSGDVYRRRCRDEVALNRRELTKSTYGLAEDLVQRALAPQTALLDREPALFEERAAHVVEAHGDLRPEHVCLAGPEPLIIDCLEFNRALRLLDPAEELAFLSMECARLGAPEVEEILFREYATMTGDQPQERLIRFYEAYGACVRARLCVWHLEDHDAQAVDKWVSRAEAYLRIAASSLA
jgi:uncharacterized protein